MSKDIVPDGPIMTKLSDYDTPHHAEKFRVWQMMCIRKKWTMALDGMSVRPFVCSECDEEFLLEMHDERWSNECRGVHGRLPSICLDCRTQEEVQKKLEDEIRPALDKFYESGIDNLDLSREDIITLYDHGYCRCGIFIDSEGYECTETCLICIHYNYEMALHEKRHATMREEPWGDGCVKGVSR